MATTRFLQIKLFGDVQLRRQLFRGAYVAGDMRPALEEIADDMMRIFGINITSGGRRGGGSWPALKPATIKAKAKEGHDPRPLISSGDLLRAVSVRGAAGQDLRISRNQISLNINLPYAAMQRFGGGHGVPGRDYMQILPKDRTGWVRTVERHLRSALVS